MKKLFLLLILINNNVFASSFDNFVGEYRVDGKVTIKSINVDAKSCIRYGLPYTQKIVLGKTPDSDLQSHVVMIENSFGPYRIDIREYEIKNDIDPNIIYFARVSGNSNMALFHEGSNVHEHFENKFLFERKNNEVYFSFSEEKVINGSLSGACYYQLKLK